MPSYFFILAHAVAALAFPGFPTVQVAAAASWSCSPPAMAACLQLGRLGSLPASPRRLGAQSSVRHRSGEGAGAAAAFDGGQL